MMQNILSIDAETNSLRGDHFAIAAVVTDSFGSILDSFEGRCAITAPVNEWVAKNVLPNLEGMEEIYADEKELINAFWLFWMKHKQSVRVIAHMPYPVETKLFDKAIETYQLGGEFDGPYGRDTLETILPTRDSVDQYIQQHGLQVPFDGAPHHPMYDCLVALVAYVHIMSQQK